jgi:hypothetical protein
MLAEKRAGSANGLTSRSVLMAPARVTSGKAGLRIAHNRERAGLGQVVVGVVSMLDRAASWIKHPDSPAQTLIRGICTTT